MKGGDERMVSQSLAEALIKGRRKAGLTQRQAAEKLEVSQAYMSKLESGESKPGKKMVEKLARLYGMDVRDLYVLRIRVNEKTGMNTEIKRWVRAYEELDITMIEKMIRSRFNQINPS